MVPPLQRFLDAAFAATGYETPPVLRGVYLTSATQAGTPIDRCWPRAAHVQPAPGGGRAPTATAASSLPGCCARSSSRRPRWCAARAGWSAGSGALRCWLERGQRARCCWLWAAGCGAISGRSKRSAASPGHSGLCRAGAGRDCCRTGCSTPTRARCVELLDAAADWPRPYPSRRPGLGLSQAGRLRAYGSEAYRRALDRIFLPHLMQRVATRLRAELGQPETAAEH